MDLRPRTFLVDEDEGLRRIPYAKFVRVHSRQQRIHLFAGQSIRAVFVIVQTDAGGGETIHHVEFINWVFDGSGLLSKEHERASLHDGVKLLSQNREWQEVHRIEYAEKFCWKPTEELLSRLHRMIHDNTKRG